jgi:hypothetical protein
MNVKDCLAFYYTYTLAKLENLTINDEIIYIYQNYILRPSNNNTNSYNSGLSAKVTNNGFMFTYNIDLSFTYLYLSLSILLLYISSLL